MKQPTTGEDVAFWAQLVMANGWFAAGKGLLALPFLALAIAIRLPYWLKQR